MIRLDHVTKRYQVGETEQIVALDGIELDINPGEFVTIVGSNGSGKSTLLNVVAGSVRCDSGKVILDGADVTQLNQVRRARSVAIVQQNPSAGIAPSLTLEENLAIASMRGMRRGLRRAISKARKALFQERLADLAPHLAQRFRQQAGHLSGGERQMLALTMATLAQTRVLCLDEHCASLDPARVPEVMRVTERIAYSFGLTILMVTHSFTLAKEYGNRLLILRRGKVLHFLGQVEKKSLSEAQLLDYLRDTTGVRLSPNFSSR